MVKYDFVNQVVIKDDKPYPFMCLTEKEQKYITDLIKNKELDDYKKLTEGCPF